MLPPKITGSIPLPTESSSANMSTPTPTKGAAKKPIMKSKSGTNFHRAWTLFPEMSKPTKTPHKIKLIVETHVITMSNSFPRTFNSLRRRKNKETVKNPVNAHNDLIKVKSSKKESLRDL